MIGLKGGNTLRSLTALKASGTPVLPAHPWIIGPPDKGSILYTDRHQLLHAKFAIDEDISDRRAGMSQSDATPPEQNSFGTLGNINSDDPLVLRGPLNVVGHVKCGGSVDLEGQIAVDGGVEAYGPLVTNGDIQCQYVLSGTDNCALGSRSPVSFLSERDNDESHSHSLARS